MLKTFSSALAALLAFGVGAAHAQAIEEIIVTAQKREQGANDVGITINAFTGAQLKDFGFTTAEDMALLTPGLTVNETAATGRWLPGLLDRRVLDGWPVLRRSRNTVHGHEPRPDVRH
jgi:outer membrane receptor protein involved in Fe transport